MVGADYQMRLTSSLVGFDPVSVDQANDLLVAWGHYLGASTRACATQAFVMEVNGDPVSVAVSAAPITQTVAGYPFNEVVELTRLCTRGDSRWATRPMLRLWREVGARKWPYWDVSAAVAYSANSRHEGAIYRFDGWEMLNERAGKLDGNSSWDYNPSPHSLGFKRLWVYRYSRGCSSTGRAPADTRQEGPGSTPGVRLTEAA